MLRIFWMFFLITLIIQLAGCQSSRYAKRYDSAPTNYGEIDTRPSQVAYEPYREVNFLPYTIRGVYYEPWQTSRGYVDEGMASWYGEKFHGYQTSNGEIYDMFAMTAAHTRLPLPSFVKVTNLENQRSTVVRVNDRGPFHPNRIIDLSYAAAKALGFAKTGTAMVRVEAIHVTPDGLTYVGDNPEPYPSTQAFERSESDDNTSTEFASQPKPTDELVTAANNTGVSPKLTDTTASLVIQVIASQDSDSITSVHKILSNLLSQQLQVEQTGTLYRLLLQPQAAETNTAQLLAMLHEMGFTDAFIVKPKGL